MRTATRKPTTIDIRDIFDLANELAKAGPQVVEQYVDVIVHGEDIEEQNVSAMEMCLSFLRTADAFGVAGCGEHIEAIATYLAEVGS